MSQQEEIIYQTLDVFEVFSPNSGFVRTITLIDENGKPTKEDVPKQYWGDEYRTNLYLKQRMKGIIGKGDEINLEEVKYTCLEEVKFKDKKVRKGLKALIEARDIAHKKNTKLQDIEAAFDIAKKQIMEINPPSKESLILLSYYARTLGPFYDEVVKDGEKAAKVAFEVGLLILDVYSKSGLKLLLVATTAMIKNGKKKKSHPYFDKAISITLKHERYDWVIQALEDELKAFKDEATVFIRRGNEKPAQKCVFDAWGRVCGICATQIKIQKLDMALKYFDNQASKFQTDFDNIKYEIPTRKICQDLLKAFKDNDKNLLEKTKKSDDLKTYLPEYMKKLINGLQCIKEKPKMLNKKHSNEQL